MEVKKGYKQTEIGIIPDDWDVGILEKYCFIIDCKHITADFIENGIPVASIREVQSRFINLENAKQTTQAYYSHLIEGGRKPQVGDLIFSRNATVGETAQVADWHPVFAVGQDVCIIRKRTPDFSSDYIQDVIRSGIVITQLSNLMAGSTFKRINVQQIKNFIVPMPMAKEQKAIAEALSDADAFIEAVEQLLTKKRQVKQGAMSELLTGKRRLSGFGNNKYKQTEIGVIPEDWDIYSLGEIGKFKNGINKGSEAFGQGTPFVNLMDIFGVSSIASSKNLGLVTCNNFERSIYDLRRGDVIFIRSSVKPSGVGLTAVVENDLPETVYSGFLIRFRDGGTIDIGYKRYCFYEERFRKSVIDSSTVSANTNINQVSLKKLCLPLPSTLAEQTAIAEILSDMDAEISALEEKLVKARQVKAGMMSVLLTGRVRLV